MDTKFYFELLGLYSLAFSTTNDTSGTSESLKREEDVRSSMNSFSNVKSERNEEAEYWKKKYHDLKSEVEKFMGSVNKFR